MGQPITVVEKPSSNPAIVRFETNRPLSGMGHEPYAEPPSELLDRPVDELARRLFAAGGVERVHINGSVVTVTLGRGRTGTGLADVVRQLFLHYGDQPAQPELAPSAEADRAPEMLADPGEAPAAMAAEEPAAADPVAPEADLLAASKGAEPPASADAPEVEGIPDEQLATEASEAGEGPEAEPTEGPLVADEGVEAEPQGAAPEAADP